MSDTENPTFAEWAIVELFGHRRLAGYLTEIEIAGKGFLRLDIPGQLKTDPTQATQLYNPTAIYAIHPTTEAIARAAAERAQQEPIQRWELERAAPRTVDQPDGDPVGESNVERPVSDWAEEPAF